MDYPSSADEPFAAAIRTASISSSEASDGPPGREPSRMNATPSEPTPSSIVPCRSSGVPSLRVVVAV